MVGLELDEALQRLGSRARCTLRFTAPPKGRGERGHIRVVGQRRVPGREVAFELVCAREYFDRRPEGNGDGSPHT